ncbi:Ribonuclease P [Methanococcus vannielii SB]|uniref:Ribonuclease P protein component 3 n=1 Tax=Methanococcus vannielii (strain ATCC 35089 / DSM 1224 / JCM 13029 / OCM 148 / SB) TaxID=406327 RepID=RNP3_METVS|nr:RNase P subunit p30 family protein [Methanococcus vannielii]A6US39.1 RecName: Full=Ribonuclease P protein component 3; Short=RNase P component 3; AltName: Full=Rpp30 [Methanococcus vannielii SB]ABR55311.1 Ribonuclease P [Methanococcus vannielii SB]
MLEKVFDINQIFDEKGIMTLKRFGWDGSVAFQNHTDFSDELIDNAKKYGEENGILVYSGLKILSNNQNEIDKIVKKYRNRVEMIFIEGGDIKINRKTLESNETDVLSTPELNRADNGLDHVLTRLGSTNRVSIELNLSNLIKNKNYDRARVLWAFQRNLMLCKKYDTPVVISSGANDIYGIKAPDDVRGFLNTLVDQMYAKKIMETTSKIVNYRLHMKKSNVLMYGLEIVE